MTNYTHISSKSYLLKEDGSFDMEKERLQHQAKILFQLEWDCLQKLNIKQPNRIMELGCGNGHYLSQWKAANPKAQISGVDRHNELLKLAYQTLPEAKLYSHNLLDFDALKNSLNSSKPDTVILRFVLQHLTETECHELLSFLAEQQKIFHFQLVLIDPDDSSVRFSPPCDELQRAVEAVIRKQAKNGGDRLRGSQFTDLCKKAGFLSLQAGSTCLTEKTIGWSSIKTILLPLWKQGTNDEASYLKIVEWLDHAASEREKAFLSSTIHVVIA